MTDYTVVLKDYSEYVAGITRVLRASGHNPESAAGDAECDLAIEIWKRRYPEIDHLRSAELGMDEAWIACMESVATLAVIEDHPTVYFEDGIYFPDDDRFVLKAHETETE